jgi:hypothetical protein
VTPFDISLIFSKISDVSGQTVQIDQVSVTMSPQHFKAFARSLGETLGAYESVFGKLQISDADTAPNTSAEQIAQMVIQNRDKARAHVAAAAAAAAGSVAPVPSVPSSSEGKRKTTSSDQPSKRPPRRLP